MYDNRFFRTPYSYHQCYYHEPEWIVTMICQVKIPVDLCISSENGSKYVLEYETERRTCIIVLGNCISCSWESLSSSNHTSGSPLYDPAVDFIGWESNLNPGQFDEGLGSSCDARYWYPPAQSYTSSSGNYANSSLYPTYSPNGGGGGLTPTYAGNGGSGKMPWNLFVYSNGRARNDWVYDGNNGGTCGGGEKRYRLLQRYPQPWSSSIKSCSKDPLPAGCAGTSILGFCFQLKYKCLFLWSIL